MANHPHSSRARRLGFTMVEMLVAMAILITVISGVVLLYSGAVNTVRQGYNAIDNFEIGRSVLAAIERDMKRAFTAREFGQYFQFHGNEDAFMFVGVLENGELGRVTYAMTALDENNDFTMQDTQSLRIVLERALNQISKIEGVFPGQATLFATELALMFARDEAISAGTISQADILTFLPAALDRAYREGLSYPVWRLGPLITDDGAYNFEDATVSLEITVRTGYMVRYEEPGVTELSSFSLPPNRDNPNPVFVGTLYNALQFPTIDPYDIDSPRNNPPMLAFNTCPGIQDGQEFVNTAGQDMLNCYSYAALVMPASGSVFDLDIRQLMTGRSFISLTSPASYVNPQTVDRIYEASKREVWLDLFTSENAALAILNGNAPTTAPTYRNFFEAWQADDNVPGPAEDQQARLANNKDPYDYVIGERMVLGGIVLTRQTIAPPDYSPFFIDHIDDFDILGINAFFTYADVDGKYKSTYNSLDDIPGYAIFATPNTNVAPADRFAAFDQELGNEMRGILTDASQGSPIAPRIPALVSPRFWIMTEGPTINDPPFKHYFDMVIEVPSSTGRKLPKQFVPNAAG